jgi:hypothetical protein
VPTQGTSHSPTGGTHPLGESNGGPVRGGAWEENRLLAFSPLPLAGPKEIGLPQAERKKNQTITGRTPANV